jgi:GNAT superfamily N-acetyltransferase
MTCDDPADGRPSQALPRVVDLEATAPPTVLEALLRTRQSDDFPPRVPPEPAALREWLDRDRPLIRLGVVCGDGEVRGHAQVTPVHDYTKRTLEAAGLVVDDHLEVAKVFVDPQCRGTGAGGLLFSSVLRRVAERGAAPCLVTLPHLTAALALYRRYGFADIGRFDGLDGVNIVMAAARDGDGR